MSASTPLKADVTYSYARRTGDGIRVVLDLGAGPAAPADTALRVVQGDRTVAATDTRPADLEGRTALAAVLPADLAHGRWRVELAPGSGEGWQRARARLLVRRQGPVVLLTGKIPAQSVKPPRRSPGATGAASQGLGDLGRQAVARLRQGDVRGVLGGVRRRAERALRG